MSSNNTQKVQFIVTSTYKGEGMQEAMADIDKKSAKAKEAHTLQQQILLDEQAAYEQLRRQVETIGCDVDEDAKKIVASNKSIADSVKWIGNAWSKAGAIIGGVFGAVALLQKAYDGLLWIYNKVNATRIEGEKKYQEALEKSKQKQEDAMSAALKMRDQEKLAGTYKETIGELDKLTAAQERANTVAQMGLEIELARRSFREKLAKNNQEKIKLQLDDDYKSGRITKYDYEKGMLQVVQELRKIDASIQLEEKQGQLKWAEDELARKEQAKNQTEEVWGKYDTKAQSVLDMKSMSDKESLIATRSKWILELDEDIKKQQEKIEGIKNRYIQPGRISTAEQIKSKDADIKKAEEELERLKTKRAENHSEMEAAKEDIQKTFDILKSLNIPATMEGLSLFFRILDEAQGKMNSAQGEVGLAKDRVNYRKDELKYFQEGVKSDEEVAAQRDQNVINESERNTREELKNATEELNAAEKEEINLTKQKSEATIKADDRYKELIAKLKSLESSATSDNDRNVIGGLRRGVETISKDGIDEDELGRLRGAKTRIDQIQNTQQQVDVSQTIDAIINTADATLDRSAILAENILKQQGRTKILEEKVNKLQSTISKIESQQSNGRQ